MHDSIFDHFYKMGIIPVIEIDSASHAVPLAESLFAGGLPVAEITRAAKQASDIVKNLGDKLIKDAHFRRRVSFDLNT